MSAHLHERPGSRRLHVRTAALLLAAAAVAGIGGGVAIARVHGGGAAAPALPAFHGQAVWGPGQKPAPAFSLPDQNGALVSLASLRGRSVLLTFLDSQCRSQCPIEGRQLGSILRRLPRADRPTLIVISVDPKGDTRAGIRHAMARWNLTGGWSWHWLNAPKARLARVWRSYGVAVEPRSGDIAHGLALYLIDRRGDTRTAYLFPFLPGFVQRDLGRLAAEPPT